MKISSTLLSEFHELCNLNFTNSTIEVCCFAEALILTDQHIWISWTLFSHELVIWKSSTQSCGFHRLNHLNIINSITRISRSLPSMYATLRSHSFSRTNTPEYHELYFLTNLSSEFHELYFLSMLRCKVTSHVHMSRVTRINKSCHMHEWVI